MASCSNILFKNPPLVENAVHVVSKVSVLRKYESQLNDTYCNKWMLLKHDMRQNTNKPRGCIHKRDQVQNKPNNAVVQTAVN